MLKNYFLFAHTHKIIGFIVSHDLSLSHMTTLKHLISLMAEYLKSNQYLDKLNK